MGGVALRFGMESCQTVTFPLSNVWLPTYLFRPFFERAAEAFIALHFLVRLLPLPLVISGGPVRL